MAEPSAYQAAPLPASIPTGSITTEPAPVSMGAPVAEAEEEEIRRLVPPRKRKYGPRFYLLAALGLLLHIFAAVILVVAIMNWMRPGPPTSRQRPTQLKKAQPKAELPARKFSIKLT